MRGILDLPTWVECEARVDAGTPTALELFVYNQEPGGPDAIAFRDQLQDVLVQQALFTEKKIRHDP